MIDPKEVLALFEEPEKNQGTILNLAYTALPDLAREVIRLREIEKAAIPVLKAMKIWLDQGCECYDEWGAYGCRCGYRDRLREYKALRQALGLSGEEGRE